MSTVNELALAWLQTRFDDAVEILSMEGTGTDWYGSTETGFDSRFTVSIKWRGVAGLTHYFDVEGEDLAELWKAVVGGPAAPARYPSNEETTE